MTNFFVSFAFLSSTSSSVKWLYNFGLKVAKFVIIFPPNLSFINQVTFAVFPLGNGEYNS